MIKSNVNLFGGKGEPLQSCRWKTRLHFPKSHKYINEGFENNYASSMQNPNALIHKLVNCSEVQHSHAS